MMQKSAIQAGGVGRFVRSAIVVILKLIVGEVGGGGGFDKLVRWFEGRVRE
jgi:hypothetical protein